MVIIKFMIILLVLVTVHEFGHFIVAKIFNVYVSEFALGFGPKIFSYKGKETLFTVRALPLGGYAAMVGEDGEIDEDLAHVPKERTIKGVNRFKQFLIMFAGSFMNLLLAFIIFCGIAAVQPTASTDPVIGNIEKGSAADQAGLKVNDRVIQLKKGDEVTKIATFTDLSLFSSLNTDGDSYEMLIERAGAKKTISVIPKFNKEEQRYMAGYSGALVEPSRNPKDIVVNGFNLTVGTSKDIFTSLKMLVTGKIGVGNLSGPVGIVKMTDDVSKNAGIMGLIQFTALLSVNLAIFNLIPIPALDGGRIFILIIESITRRKINPELEARIIGVSFILLMGLIIFVTFNDFTGIFK